MILCSTIVQLMGW